MASKTTPKTFDCVKTKNAIQAAILAEYESQKDAFPSFEAFVKAQVRKSAWARRMKRRFARRRRNPPV
jgi:hypothetical protein